MAHNSEREREDIAEPSEQTVPSMGTGAASIGAGQGAAAVSRSSLRSVVMASR